MTTSRVSWVAVLVATTLVGLSLFWARTEGPLRAPVDALADFYKANGRAEDQIIDPLVLAGSDVVPVVIEAIADGDMPRRRYAITFVGIARRRDAIPVLAKILNDETEIYYMRADALGALYRIDPAVAELHARRYSKRSDSLGQVATEISSGSYSPAYDRTWWDAFRSVHH